VMPVGCGGNDEKPAPTQAQFVARADAVCKQLRGRLEPIQKRINKASNPRLQSRLIRQQKSHQEDALRSLQAIGAPKADKQTVARYVSAVRKRRDLTEKLARAASTSDVVEARALLLDGVGISRDADRSAKALGLKQCEEGKPPTRRDVLAAFTPDVGEPVELTAEGTDVTLTVKALIDPLEAGTVEPPGGIRYVGIRLVVENTGNKSIDIPISQQSTLITNKDEQLDSDFLGAGGECEKSLNVVNLSPGSKRRGCIPFQVPKSQKAKTFQFGGRGGDTAEWDLTTAKPVSGATDEPTAGEQARDYLDCVQEAGSPEALEACQELLGH
jgi:hypothetical protein